MWLQFTPSLIVFRPLVGLCRLSMDNYNQFLIIKSITTKPWIYKIVQLRSESIVKSKIGKDVEIGLELSSPG